MADGSRGRRAGDPASRDSPRAGVDCQEVAPIRRRAVRFSSAIRTFSSTCCEVGTRIRLMTWAGHRGR